MDPNEYGEGWLDPDQYEDDIAGADEFDEEEYTPEDLEDADENGNLKGFIVPDDEVEYEDGVVDSEEGREDQVVDEAAPPRMYVPAFFFMFDYPP